MGYTVVVDAEGRRVAGGRRPDALPNAPDGGAVLPRRAPLPGDVWDAAARDWRTPGTAGAGREARRAALAAQRAALRAAGALAAAAGAGTQVARLRRVEELVAELAAAVLRLAALVLDDDAPD